MAGADAVLLGQHAGGHGTGSGEVIMTVFLATVLVVIWVALGVVCWIFWRAKKREDEAKAREGMKWSAPSS